MFTDGVTRILKNLPESVGQELSAIAVVHRRDYWRIGDITNQIIELIKARIDLYPDIGEMDVYKAVAILLHQEYSARTIRDYASVSGSFDLEYREIYDLLPFSHFRYARTFGDRWQEILDYSIAVAHENNRPPSVDFLEMKFHPAVDPDNAPEWDGAEEGEPRKFDSDTMLVGEDVSIKKALQTLKTGVYRLNAPEPIYSAICALLGELEKILQPLIDRAESLS